MKRLICLLFVLASTAAAQVPFTHSVVPHMVLIDSTKPVPLPIAPRYAGTATIGGGDSVTVAIDGATNSDVVLLVYASGKTAEAVLSTMLSWQVNAEGTLTLYGTSGKAVSYLIFR